MTEKRASVLAVIPYVLVGILVGKKLDVDFNDPMYWLLLIPPYIVTLNVIAFFYGKTMSFGFGHCSADSSKAMRISALIFSIILVTLYMWNWFGGNIYPGFSEPPSV